jgi:uncharacterized repeat protein (TIGR01451 family)
VLVSLRRRVVGVAALSVLVLLLAAALPARGRAAVGPSLTLRGSGLPSGGAAIYTIIVANLGDTAAPAVQLEGVLPIGVALHGASPNQGACVAAFSSFSCALGDVAPGYPAMITL